MDDPRIEALRAAVAAHTALDEAERSSCAVLQAELERLRAPFDQQADPTHVTGSAIVTDGQDRVVLHRHKRLGIWLQPGGHVEGWEPPSAAARRETLEETGLVASHPDAGPALLHVDVHPGPRGHRHLDVRYLLLAAADAVLRPAAGESADVAWFSVDGAVELADASLATALRALRLVGRRSVGAPLRGRAAPSAAHPARSSPPRQGC